jgi:uncharacterized protein YajQ (UPF0234 family)
MIIFRWQIQDSNLGRFPDGFTVRSHWPLGQSARVRTGHPVALREDIPGPAAPPIRLVQGSGGASIVADPSFDVVSKVDRQEVDNALNQTGKELSQRFDFKGTGASIAWSGEKILMEAESEERVKAILDVFKEKLIKRQVSLKVLDAGEPQLSGKEYKIFADIQEGISMDNAKKVSKLIRDEGPKGVQAAIQGDQLRVSAKKKDDLQAVIALLKGAEFDFALQFVNYR